MTSPADVAYLKGYSDGFESVAYVTRKLYGAYVLIGLLSIVIVWQAIGRAPCLS